MPSVLSTKKLKLNQRELVLNAGFSFVEYDAITITNTPYTIPEKIDNVIITSQNGARAFLQIQDEGFKCYTVGKKTTALLADNGLKIEKTAQNAVELARFIVKNYKNEHFHYFCGNRRRDELPTILKEAQVSFEEVITYNTSLTTRSFDQGFDGILFYSPSGVEAFAKANTLEKTTAFCIGNTTATEARKHTNNVIVSNATTIESTIAKTVKTLAIRY